MILALLAGFAFAQDDCDDPDGRIRAAERDLLNFYLQDASVAAKEAVDAFGCSGKAHPETVARLLLAEGMIKFFGDDLAGAELAFGSAKGIAPDQWNPDYGDKAKEMFDGILVEKLDPVDIALKGFNDQADWAAVDGGDAKPPLALQPGMHLLQVGHSDVARFARVIEIEVGKPLTISVPGGPLVEVTDDTDNAVTVGIVEEPTPVEAGPIKRKRRRRVMASIAMGTISAGLYGGAVAGRVMYDNQTDPKGPLMWTVNGLYGASVAGGVTSGSMMIGAIATPPVK